MRRATVISGADSLIALLRLAANGQEKKVQVSRAGSAFQWLVPGPSTVLRALRFGQRAGCPRTDHGLPGPHAPPVDDPINDVRVRRRERLGNGGRVGAEQQRL